MGKECPMMEVLKLPHEEEEEEGDESELSLELSIGGKYGKLPKNGGNILGSSHGTDNSLNHNSRSVFSRGKDDTGAENGVVFLDLQRKKEIQAVRRLEARKKREEKLRKSRGLSLNPHKEDKFVMEAQQFQARARDRENREKDGFSEDSARKRDKNGATEDSKDLNLCLFAEHKAQFPSVQYLPVANGLLERSSSVVSDYQSTSHKGGNSSDTGSHSNSLNPGQRCGSPGSDMSKPQSEPIRSSGETMGKKPCKMMSYASIPRQPSLSKSTEKSRPDSRSDQTNITCSTSENTSPPLSKEMSVEKPPKPKLPKSQDAASVQHMPYVSTTGNGPNGKTITGFLYKYTKSEVSIMCVCHGTSFSPAGFVEHAGGVDVSHPLKHITIVPSAFG